MVLVVRISCAVAMALWLVTATHREPTSDLQRAVWASPGALEPK